MLLRLIIIASLLLTLGMNNKPSDVVKREATVDIKNKINPLLDEYCQNACQIIDVTVSLNEDYPNNDDIGFESQSEESLIPNYSVANLKVTIQIDKRVTQKNKERLEQILKNHLEHETTQVQLEWVALEIPQIGANDTTLDTLKEQVADQLTRNLSKVVARYCPDTCLIPNVLIRGHLINGDEAFAIPQSERKVVSDANKQAFMAIDSITIEVSLDQKLDEKTRTQILNMMTASTRMYDNVGFEIDYPEFPETFSQQQERLAKESQDPYGLDKLRQMLILFRELAGTKEVITTNNSSSQNSSSSDSTSKESSASQTNSSNSSESKNSSDIQSSQQALSENWVIYIVGIIILFGIIAFVLMRFSSAKRDTEYLTMASGPQGSSRPRNGSGDHEGHDDPSSLGHSQNSSTQEVDISLLKKNLVIDQLKKELTALFMENPKVAKETFSRLLQEEGVEETAKYVHIFGKLIVFELLNDPSLQRRLYELSEYYHKSNYNFTVEEEESLLRSLKKRVTANEIRILTGMANDQFDFLTRLDPSQLFNLIKDENPQVQSVVLTQLTPSRRRGVFEMFVGESKIQLLKQLCAADAIPKEYLFNIAKLLAKKMLSKPEFDTQNLKSSDILLDLLEKATLSEQQSLMRNLLETNPEAARTIKTKFVTVEMLSYLKDGHLLELVLGLNQDDLTDFLGGCPEHIQKLLLSRAPRELAQSWIEELNSRVSIDADKYRLVEITILEKIRHLASNGAINVMDINDLIFGTTEDLYKGFGRDTMISENYQISSGKIVA